MNNMEMIKAITEQHDADEIKKIDIMLDHMENGMTQHDAMKKAGLVKS